MIYLIGFMGSGKSTVGEQLSRLRQLPHIEMDEAIEAQENMTIAKMFSLYGESYFREKEENFLMQLQREAVVSTGGGVILSAENRDILNKGTVVYLKASWDTITSRLTNDTARPLWQGEENEKKARFDERLPIYEQLASLTVVVDDKSPSEITREIINRLKK